MIDFTYSALVNVINIMVIFSKNVHYNIYLGYHLQVHICLSLHCKNYKCYLLLHTGSFGISVYLFSHCLQALGLALGQDPIPRPTTGSAITHGSIRTNVSFEATTGASGGRITSGAEVRDISAVASSAEDGADIITTDPKTGKTSGKTISNTSSSNNTPTAPRGGALVHALPRSSRVALILEVIPAGPTGHPRVDHHSRMLPPAPTLSLPSAAKRASLRPKRLRTEEREMALWQNRWGRQMEIELWRTVRI